MRIVLVSDFYVPVLGGAERLMQAVAERLAQRGHDVTVLTLDFANHRDVKSNVRAGLPSTDLLNGVRIIRVDPRTGTLYQLYRWWLRQPGGWRVTRLILGEDFRFWSIRPNGLRIRRELLRVDADVICSMNFGTTAVYWSHVVAARRRIPHVTIPLLHIEAVSAEDLPFYSRVLTSAGAVLVQTTAEADFVKSSGATAVFISGCGADPDRFQHRDGAAVRKRLGLGDEPVVGYVGRQSVPKGVPTLIAAMQRVWRSRPDAVLLLAGPLAARDPEVGDALASLSAAERQRVVEVHDFADSDGPSIIDACDVIALPSVAESFGIVFVEAWMCSKPVIGGDITATRCLIEAGVDGLLAKPFDDDALSSRILDLLGNPARRIAMGERGHEKALAHYTWDRVTDVWDAAFQSALGLD